MASVPNFRKPRERYTKSAASAADFRFDGVVSVEPVELKLGYRGFGETMVEETTPGEAAEPVAVRDARGRIDEDFIETVESAIAAGDAPRVRTLAGSLHEADVGDLISALEPEARGPFVRLLGDDFDFAALTE